MAANKHTAPHAFTHAGEDHGHALNQRCDVCGSKPAHPVHSQPKAATPPTLSRTAAMNAARRGAVIRVATLDPADPILIRMRDHCWQTQTPGGVTWTKWYRATEAHVTEVLTSAGPGGFSIDPEAAPEDSLAEVAPHGRDCFGNALYSDEHVCGCGCQMVALVQDEHGWLIAPDAEDAPEDALPACSICSAALDGDGSCPNFGCANYLLHLPEEPTAYEESLARRTGASVEQLRAETAAAMPSLPHPGPLYRVTDLAAVAGTDTPARSPFEGLDSALAQTLEAYDDPFGQLLGKEPLAIDLDEDEREAQEAHEARLERKGNNDAEEDDAPTAWTTDLEDRCDSLSDLTATDANRTQETVAALIALARLHQAEFARLIKAEEDETATL